MFAKTVGQRQTLQSFVDNSVIKEWCWPQKGEQCQIILVYSSKQGIEGNRNHNGNIQTVIDLGIQYVSEFEISVDIPTVTNVFLRHHGIHASI